MEFPNYGVFKSAKIILTAKSVDPDEMQHYAVFHLGLYCLQKKFVQGCPKYKGLLEFLVHMIYVISTKIKLSNPGFILGFKHQGGFL